MTVCVLVLYTHSSHHLLFVCMWWLGRNFSVGIHWNKLLVWHHFKLLDGLSACDIFSEIVLMVFRFFIATANPHRNSTIWLLVKTLAPSEPQNSWDLWMFIPLELIIIGFDPPPYGNKSRKKCHGRSWSFEHVWKSYQSQIEKCMAVFRCHRSHQLFVARSMRKLPDMASW